MKAANPYLNFNGNTEEAFTFYRSVFGGDFLAVLRFSDFGGGEMGIAEAELDKIAHIALPLGPTSTLMGTDILESAAREFRAGNNFFITIEPDTAEEAGRLFEALSAGGRIEMPLEQTSWAELHGQCEDRFGVQWMIDYTGNVQFSGQAAG